MTADYGRVTRMYEPIAVHGTRRRYAADGGVLTIDVTTCEYDRSANGLMTLWVRYGFVPGHIERAIWAQTYLQTKDGQLTDMFNPQVTDDGKIDFAWLLEATPENEERLIGEILRRYRAWSEGRKP